MFGHDIADDSASERALGSKSFQLNFWTSFITVYCHSKTDNSSVRHLKNHCDCYSNCANSLDWV